MKLVVDTSILIDYLRGGNKWEDVVREVKVEGEFFLPTIAIFELFAGESTRKPQTQKKILDIIDFFQKIELTEEIAKKAGELYRDIRKDLQSPDYIVAASALRIGGSVVTLNRKHFEQIPGLSLFEEFG